MTLINRWLLTGLVLALVAFAPACGDDDDDDAADADDDDGDDDEGNQEAFDSCDETTTVLDGSDVASSLLGISADDILTETDGGFTVTANYGSDTSILTQSPLGGETELTVTIAYNGGEIREIESVPADSGSGAEIEAICLHRLELDVDVAVSTADGAFAEDWSMVLTQSVASDGVGLADPVITEDFDPYGLGGDFEIVSISGSTPDAVTATFSSTAVDPVTGDIQIFVEQSSGSGDEGTVSQASHIALSWGDAS